MSVGAAPFRLDWEQVQVLQQDMFPWARRCASGLKVNLMNVYYEKHFEENLDEFCQNLGFEPYNSVNK
jgi:ubiquinone biosynthesis protein Coq4